MLLWYLYFYNHELWGLALMSLMCCQKCKSGVRGQAGKTIISYNGKSQEHQCAIFKLIITSDILFVPQRSISYYSCLISYYLSNSKIYIISAHKNSDNNLNGRKRMCGGSTKKSPRTEQWRCKAGSCVTEVVPYKHCPSCIHMFLFSKEICCWRISNIIVKTKYPFEFKCYYQG